jgi:hypothetical protein
MTVEDIAYSTEEIRKLLDVADERLKVVMLLTASSSIRIDALPALILTDLEKIEVEE